jgi:hypothetical protein
MKRRDFLKISATSVIAGTVVAHEAISAVNATNTNTEPSAYQEDWSVKFRVVTAHVTQETYGGFFNDGRYRHTPENFLRYLLSSTRVPCCKAVGSMTQSSSCDIVKVVFTEVVFASSIRQFPDNFFTGYEHARFCLSSPDSKSGMYLTFSEEVA